MTENKKVRIRQISSNKPFQSILFNKGEIH